MKKHFGRKKQEGEFAERKEFKPWEKKKGYRKKFKSRNDFKKAFVKTTIPQKFETSAPAETGLIRLNKYLSNAGICSRREADAFIKAGAVKVNGKVVTQMGYKVSPGDKVQFGNETVKKERMVYILLNKPKGYITTTNDERDRAAVLNLVQGIAERVYPVGRLDRNTSGLLLLTNDGDLAVKLMHPKHRVAKIYHVILDKPVKPDDFDKLRSGVELEDGFMKPDDIAYVDGAETKKEIGIEIHSGKNRVIRRMFEHLGYTVVKLDRVLYAGLTKKNLGRGKWRYLSEGEVRMLKKIR